MPVGAEVVAAALSCSTDGLGWLAASIDPVVKEPGPCG